MAIRNRLVGIAQHVVKAERIGKEFSDRRGVREIVGAGIEAAPSSSAVRPAAVGALRFYQSAGLLIGYTQAVMEEDPLERSLADSKAFVDGILNGSISQGGSA